MRTSHLLLDEDEDGAAVVVLREPHQGGVLRLSHPGPGPVELPQLVDDGWFQQADHGRAVLEPQVVRFFVGQRDRFRLYVCGRDAFRGVSTEVDGWKAERARRLPCLTF